ncbi:sensor histidine kinase [Bacillus marinisedimentorum]|uniref:sensor histidine kinase n=1 Tax=Bacillus marinisedimentorum TaxID=1821260 RepID=UPI0009F3EC49|nr:histidine kinase [Bacillus marinisedimentorum]
MIRIRTKLLIYFSILVILANAIALFLFWSSQKTVNDYHESLERFLLLNDITQMTSDVDESLNAYIIEKDPRLLEKFHEDRARLAAEQERISAELSTGENYLTVANYTNMITSFLEEADETITAFRENEINAYSQHLNEASKIAGFIHETTLTLINNDLTAYQQYYEKLAERNKYFRLMFITLFTAMLFLGLLLAAWFSRGVTRPISSLSKAAREIAAGDFAGQDVQVRTKDELQFLAGAFNQMRANIRELVTEIQEQSELDKLLKEMELKTLQSQINPHFLFNTLNTISRMAFIEGAHKSSELIESIAALLRYNLGNLDRPVTVADEVSIVKEYFFIQQTRFGDRVKFEAEIDEGAESIQIPSLTLQPIIENAFIHGIEEMESDALLKLRVCCTEKQAVIEVIDNGRGMTADVIASIFKEADRENADLEELVHRKKSGHSTGIGLKNVIRRLRLFYKKEDVMEIDSEPGTGTTVRLLLPINEKGDGVQ